LKENINISEEGDSNPTNLIAVNWMLHFSADDSTNGRELWISDDTESKTNTVWVTKFDPDGNLVPSFPVDVEGTLFFSEYPS
jgi:ELWxxDGT repeat protein